MSLTPEMLDAMMAAGLSAEQIVAVTKAALVAEEGKRAAKRANNAARQQRFRDKKKATTVTPSNALCDVTERDARYVPPPKKVPLEPPINTPPPSGPNGLNDDSAQARGPHRLPRDFRISETDRQFCRDHGWSEPEIDDGEAEFVDFWSNPKLAASKALKSDWSATWRNRVRDMGKRRGTGPPRSSSSPRPFTVVNGANSRVQGTQPTLLDVALARVAARQAS
jgi:hypothetical protein